MELGRVQCERGLVLRLEHAGLVARGHELGIVIKVGKGLRGRIRSAKGSCHVVEQMRRNQLIEVIVLQPQPEISLQFVRHMDARRRMTELACMVQLSVRGVRRTLVVLVVLTGVPSATLGAQSLSNALVRAEFGPRGLISITDRADGRTHRFTTDDFAVILDGQQLDGATLAAPARSVSAERVTYRYVSGAFTVRVSYEIRAGWHFVSKRIAISGARTIMRRVQDVTLFKQTLADEPTEDFHPTSARPSFQTADYGATMRFADGHALLVIAQNPFLHFTRNGAAFSLRYAPDMDWSFADGEFLSDRGLIAPVKLSGRRLPARMIPEWRTTGDSAPGMDEAEVAAFTGMVRSLFIYEPKEPINVFVGWCVNDYQIDVGTPEGRAEYRRVFDQASAAGAQFVLYAPSNSLLSRREESVDDWSWEHVLWLGLGQKIRKGEWDPKSSPVPASVSEMVSYAGAKQLKLLAYVYPVLPFTHNQSWLVPSPRDPKRQAASLGSRALQDWLIEEMVAFHHRTGIAGFSFDHTFLTFEGTSRYAQWWGWRRVMEELRRRIPDVVIDGRQAYHQYGPWSWLAGSYPHPTFNDEQPESFTPYPDLHFDRVSADRERYTAYRYRNYEFTPSELVPGFITHQTSRSDDRDEMPSQQIAGRGTVLTSYRARDWDYLGWRYSVLSSIAVAGWNNVLNMLPARDSAENSSFSEADRAWMRSWLRWTVTNKELLRRTRTILGQPALGKIDGTTAIDGDHGFIFLFNPDARRLDAQFTLDGTLGVTRGSRYVLREVHPLQGRRLGKPGAGVWSRGDAVHVTLDGGSALVLEIAPAVAARREPVVFGVPGTARLVGDVLHIEGARGEPGTTAHVSVVLPRGAVVRSYAVNGTVLQPFKRTGDIFEFDVSFAGSEFHQLQSLLTVDSTFAGGQVRGTFTVPKRIFEQLAERRRRWPIPWTLEDHTSTWLVPERLLLYAQFAEPDDKWEASLRIDGRTVELRKAYTAVRTVRSTFVGFYADLSLLHADRSYRLELDLPALAPGQFRGLYFENVEPEYTAVIVSRSPR